MRLLYGFIILLLLPIAAPGQTWHEAPAAGGPSYISFLAAEGGIIYAGTWGSGVYVSADKGESWTPMHDGLSNAYIYALCAGRDFVLAGTEGAGIYKCNTYRRKWRQSNTGLEDKVVFALAQNRSVVAAATWQGGVFLSADSGETWKKGGAGLGKSVIYSIHARGGAIYAGTSQNGVYRSDDNGMQWENIGLGGMSVLCILTVGESVLLGTWKNGIYRYSPADHDLVQIAPGGGEMVKSAALKPETNTIFCAKRERGVYASSDYGHTWTCEGLEGNDVYSILSLEDRIIAGTWGDGIYLKRDKDTAWMNRRLSPEPPLMTAEKTTRSVPEAPLFAGGVKARTKASAIQEPPHAAPESNRILEIKACSKENIVVCYRLKHSGRVSVALYDFSGRELIEKTGDAKKGTVHKTDFSKHGLDQGLYFVVVSSGADFAMTAVTFVR